MKYRKKPIVIEAMQWDGSRKSQTVIVEWSNGAIASLYDGIVMSIATLEGVMLASPKDWIIKGVKGFTPASPISSQPLTNPWRSETTG